MKMQERKKGERKGPRDELTLFVTIWIHRIAGFGWIDEMTLPARLLSIKIDYIVLPHAHDTKTENLIPTARWLIIRLCGFSLDNGPSNLFK